MSPLGVRCSRQSSADQQVEGNLPNRRQIPVLQLNQGFNGTTSPQQLLNMVSEVFLVTRHSLCRCMGRRHKAACMPWSNSLVLTPCMPRHVQRACPACCISTCALQAPAKQWCCSICLWQVRGLSTAFALCSTQYNDLGYAVHMYDFHGPLLLPKSYAALAQTLFAPGTQHSIYMDRLQPCSQR